MRLLAVFDVLKHSATEDSTYAEEEEDLVFLHFTFWISTSTTMSEGTAQYELSLCFVLNLQTNVTDQLPSENC